MTDKKSLKEHWSDKEEYLGKYIVQLMPPTGADGQPDWNAEVYDDTPVVIENGMMAAWNKAVELGYRPMTDEKGAQNVMIQCWLGKPGGPTLGFQ